MQEEQTNTEKQADVAVTPVEPVTPAVSDPVAPAPAKNPLWRDLLIPISIVIAGAFVGAGMYFDGGTGGGTPEAQTFQGLLYALADESGVKKKDFDACMENSTEQANNVQADTDNAIETGGRGTPWSIVIGPTGKTYPLNGALPVAAVEQIIELARSEGEALATEEELNTDAYAPVTEQDYIKGSLDAEVTIIEYSDFDCPFCSRFHTTMEQVKQKHPDIAWVYRHFPLDQLHPNARTVAVAAECVGELEGNDAFWTFTDGYFASK